MKLIVAAVVGACALLTAVPSARADKVAQQAGPEAPSSDVPDVPGENIFGFTDPTSTNMRIGLSRGWADIYTAELSDNYVSFGAGDGLYLVRVWADPDDHIVETNERDNVAYSLIRVEGDAVELLERARGTSPWDPDRVVLRGLGD